MTTLHLGLLKLTADTVWPLIPPAGEVRVRVDCNSGYTYIYVTPSEWHSLEAYAAEVGRLKEESEDLARKSIDDHIEYKRRRNEQFAAYEELQIKLAAAEAANAAIEVLDRAEINGHIDIAEQCRDYLASEDDPSGKLQDFVDSLRVVIDELDRNHRRRNWFEVAYEAGKEKLIESRIAKALEPIRAAARAYAHQVNQLGLAADDNDPKVMATAGPIGKAQAELWMALGIYEERKPCGFGVDGGDCYACEVGTGNTASSKLAGKGE